MNNPNQLTPELALQILRSLFAQRGGGGFSLGGGAQPRETIADKLSALTREEDPVGYANKMSALPSDAPGSTSPFAPGMLFDQNRARLEAAPYLAATNGNDATNQLRRLRDPSFGAIMDKVASMRINRPSVGTVTGVTPDPGMFVPSRPRLGPGQSAMGMINPRATNPFTDSNWWSASGAPVNPARAR